MADTITITGTNKDIVNEGIAAIYQAGYKQGFDRGVALATKDAGYLPIVYGILAFFIGCGGILAIEALFQ